MADLAEIASVRSATVCHVLKQPHTFGAWVIREREFFVVRIDSTNGHSGYAYGLTRGAPLAQLVRQNVRAAYIGRDASRPADLFHSALRSNLPVLASGVGMRALSVTDIATWDLAAKSVDQSMVRYIGGPPVPLPVTAVIGYPPTAGREEIASQVRTRAAEGWTSFKLPGAVDRELNLERLGTVREVLPTATVAVDMANMLTSVEEAVDLDRALAGLDLAWIEDLVPPGDAALVSEIRRRCRAPIAMGDEQGGAYYPEALLAARAIDILRVDATTNGGVTRLIDIVRQAEASRVQLAPHMFPHIHARIFAGLGVAAPIEWGLPDTGIHPMDDSLEQPQVKGGFMSALSDAPGFGELIDVDWVFAQQVEDPEGLFDG